MRPRSASWHRNILAPSFAAMALALGGASIAQTPAPAGAPITRPQTLPGHQGEPHAIQRGEHHGGQPGAYSHGPAHGQAHHAHAGHRHGEHDGGMMGKGMLRGLNLSEAQRDLVFSIMHTQAPAMREQTKQVRKARQDLQALAMAGDLDDSRLRAAADRASRAMADLAVLRTRTHNEVFKVLTAEQQAQLRARIEQRHQHGHGSHRS